MAKTYTIIVKADQELCGQYGGRRFTGFVKQETGPYKGAYLGKADSDAVFFEAHELLSIVEEV